MPAYSQIKHGGPAVLPTDLGVLELQLINNQLTRKRTASKSRSATLLLGPLKTLGPLMTDAIYNELVLDVGDDGTPSAARPKICEYCKDFDITAGSRVGVGGADRRDSDVGYDPLNLACACRACNMTKNTAPEAEFTAKADRVATKHPIAPADWPTREELSAVMNRRFGPH